MAWPLSRLFTYISGVTPVRSNDLNLIQDAIINGQHGEKPFCISAIAAVQDIPLAWDVDLANGAIVSTNAYADGAFIPLPLGQGDRLLEITYSVFGNGVPDLTFELRRTSAPHADAIEDAGAATETTTPVAAWVYRTLTFPGGLDPLDENESLYVRFEATDGGASIGIVSGIFDHPV